MKNYIIADIQKDSFFFSRKIFLLSLAIFSFLLYSNTLTNEYNLDDELVTLNHRLTSKGISAIPEIISSPYYQDAMGYKYEYRPVVLVSFAIEHSLFGENPHVSHTINVLLFSLTILLTFLVLERLLSLYSLILPFLICLLFAAHPLHTEAIANIKNRDELLALLFALIAWLWSIRYMTNTGNILFAFIIISLSYILSILSKQSTIGLSLIIPVSIILFKDVKTWRVFALSIIFSIITITIIPLNNINHKIILSLFCVIAPISLNFLIQNDFLSSIKKRKEQFLKTDTGQREAFEISTITFSANLSSYQLLILIALFIIIFFSGILIDMPLVVFLSICFFLLAFIFDVNKEHKNWLFLILSCVVTLTAYFYPLNSAYNFILVFFSFITISYNAVNRKIAFFATLLLMLPAILELDFSFIPYALALFVYAFTKNVRLLYLLVGINVINIFSYYFQFGVSEPIRYLSPAISLVALLIYMSSEKMKSIGFLLITLLIPFFFAVDLIYDNPIPKIDLLKSFDSQDINANILPKSDRPILFMEMPLRFDSPTILKIGTSAYVLAEYLKLMIVPHPMSFYYGYAHIVPVNLNNSQSIISILVHLTLLVVSLTLIRKHSVLSFGIIYYLISIAMFSNLLYPVVGIMADRFTYVASLGFCISIGYLLYKIFRIDISKNAPFKFNPSFIILIVFVLGAYSYKTIARNALWKDHLTLMRHDIKNVDNSAQAHIILGQNLMKYSYYPEYLNDAKNMYNEALIHFKKSAEIYPYYLNVWVDMGRIYLMKSDSDNAYRCFQIAHSIDSTYSQATLQIAKIAELKKDYSTAIVHYERLIRLNPYIKESYDNLSYLYYRIGKLDKSIEINKMAIRQFPDVSGPFENIALVYMELKDTVNADLYKQEAQKRK